jgi:phosphoglycerate dehydrogenase-like enzyme
MPNHLKVLVAPAGRPMDQIFHPNDLDRVRNNAEVLWGRDEPVSRAEFDRMKGEVNVLVAGWDHQFWDVAEMPELRAVMEVSGSHPSPSTIDYPYCFANGIRVLSCAPAFGPGVAEMGLAMTLAACREVVVGHNAFRRGEELYHYDGNVGTYSLYGQTIGFIGYGGLARSLQRLLAPWGGTVLAHDPWLPDTMIRQGGAEPVSLDDLLRRSTVVYVLAIPSEENYNLIDRQKLDLLQDNATFVLLSRAHLVDMDALAEALSDGRFRAAIDVFEPEPCPPDHPIRCAPNTILSAHRAGSVAAGLRLIGQYVADDIEAMAHGLPPYRMQLAQPEIVARRGVPRS